MTKGTTWKSSTCLCKCRCRWGNTCSTRFSWQCTTYTHALSTAAASVDLGRIDFFPTETEGYCFFVLTNNLTYQNLMILYFTIRGLFIINKLIKELLLYKLIWLEKLQLSLYVWKAVWHKLCPVKFEERVTGHNQEEHQSDWNSKSLATGLEIIIKLYCNHVRME